tara:strand:- start:7816 stop:11217 length:3402 start_codon:yes stop_codon:yes gene_type:complete
MLSLNTQHSSLFLTFIALSKEVKNSIRELLEETSRFNLNDVLVNSTVDNKKLLFTEELAITISDFPNRILSETKKVKKESGVNSLCLATECVQLKVKENQVQTPIFLNSLSFSVDKIKNTITLSSDEDAVFFNPFFVQYLKNELNINAPFPDPKETEVVLKWVQHLGLVIDENHPIIIGNFHHHRFQIVKELEELLQKETLSSSVESIFGEGKKENLTINFPKDVLLSTDIDHQKVFETVTESNTVIQGPPGTGKSQVLTNVIAKILSAKKTSIVVSEKRVALEVLVKKLSDFGLDKYCFIASSDKLSHAFLQELKATWNHLDSYEFEHVNNLRLSEQYLDNLQMTLDLLSQKNLIGGVSFHDFHKLAEGVNLSSFTYSSEVQEIDYFLAHQHTVEKVYKLGLFSSLGKLKIETILDKEFDQIDRKINRWISTISSLEKTLDFSSWESFDTLKKEAAICQVFENDLYKTHTQIFNPNSKAQRKFLSLRKKYIKSKSEIEKISKNTSHWKIVISESETKSLLDQLERSSFLSKYKTRKRWKQVSTLPVIDAQNELRNHLAEIGKINDFSQNSIEFCEMGLENPEIDVPLIYQTLYAYSENEWKKIAGFPADKKATLTNSHKKLSDLHIELKRHFHFNASDKILPILEKIKEDLNLIIPIKDELKLLDQATLFSFSRNNNYENFKGELFVSHWVNFQTKFPAFSKFETAQIKDKTKDILHAQKEEFKLFAKSIENNVYQRFLEYNDLLSIPARKLSEELKAKKARLRKGKAILIKEFSKTRSHPSLRELQNSEAREWIQLLKPIWLSNPTQVGKCFPMETALFDVAIFDEASQIPLQNSLGTIERSKRIIVAGDEHQMGPSSYFSAGTSEPVDLLHQASFYWDKVSLKHHYRSVHADLISFSNQHFYKNELSVFPSVGAKNPIQHYFCEDGVFEERKNLNEAKMIAQSIESAIKRDITIGIVAFSEEQLSCIWNNLSAKTQGKLSEKIENNEVFFKAMENVQGDECDELFISFGYAKNADGEFHLRFGPMSTVGGRKRLNVLLTRAKERIHFFCSVQAGDFKLSENESVNLLKKWILFSENYQENSITQFPFSLTIQIMENKLTIENIQEQISSAEELVTFQEILESRGWLTSYT